MRGIIVASWILAVFVTAACSRQESGWENARREDTVAAYQEYLESFPAGSHAAEASAALLRLREAAAWARAERLRTPEAWQQYLGDWPEGRHAELARRLLLEFMPPAAPAPSPATGAFEIQLGAYSDEAAARAGLERLLREHAADLDGLSARVAIPEDAEPALWRLRAGPLDEARARELCEKLKTSGVDCVPAGAESAGEAPP
jgi:SPOR domain